LWKNQWLLCKKIELFATEERLAMVSELLTSIANLRAAVEVTRSNFWDKSTSSQSLTTFLIFQLQIDIKQQL